MKKVIIWMMFFIYIIPINAQQGQKKFLTTKQISDLYNLMISEIEYVDAEAIVVRNKTKQVNWDEYKAYHQKQFIKADSYKSLRKKFLDFGKGFTSGHSYFKFSYPIEKQKKDKIKSSIKIGFTYPEIVFFDLESKRTISKINDKSIKDIFQKFINYETRANGIGTCQSSFKYRFEQGSLKVDGHLPNEITFEDGSKKEVTYSVNNDAESSYDRYMKQIEIDQYKGWRLIERGYKTALLIKDNVALVKIKNFAYNRGDNDLRCTKAVNDSTVCNDITKIRNGLKSVENDISYLIFDVQDNPGGNENSSFLAEFCPSEFKDLRIQYKKTAILEDNDLRTALSYGFPGANRWFDEISENGIYDKTENGSFLPPRGDFCRGGNSCELKYIEPNETAKRKVKKIIVLVNERTASSADDFVYRMKEYGNAIIVGQPQSADLTFALIGIVFYIDDQGNIRKMYTDNNQRNYDVPGIELFQFSVPYSRTVNKKGEMLQGNPLKPDLLLEITKDNFENREQIVLNKAIEEFVTKENN
ncbi:Peptidase family S41 [Aquimarina amphilecti]|uniref:Peptidase family S41 n=1 Tax=Aquimarina amphilecti TaxID=1038014 RepID=A0A1H7G7A5_AQUAM|nr:S41 family peptidase [Aquimarina amphilecti]SEK31645.1 Peptidase family S41 [Aquimarina amphilecti]